VGLEIRREWPMESYLAAWKTFRQTANENKSIARHLTTQPSWPRGKKLRICDVGCGDGRLIEAITLETQDEIAAVSLVDPDPELLDEAVRCIAEEALVPNITRTLATAEMAFPACATGHDIVLMVHVVYLIESEHLVRLLEAMPPEVVAYVIFDEPESVFTTLWRETAPKFHGRVLEAHKIMKALPRTNFAIAETKVEAQVANPFTLPREDVRRAILSLLCYSTEAADDMRTRGWIESTVSRYVDSNGQVLCRSGCYEIRRRLDSGL
jgi:2-polyprenyl-3-methyl-5-hydroxy-6-metoxy-1,4-benzoquinol methylase